MASSSPNAAMRSAAALPHRAGVEAAERAGVVEQLRAREPVEEAQPIGQHAGRLLRRARVGPRVDVVDAHRAGVGTQQAGDHRERRGLARAVRSDDAEERPGAHVERDAVDGRVVAEALHQALDGQYPAGIGGRCRARHAQRALLARRGARRRDHGDRLLAHGCRGRGVGCLRYRPSRCRPSRARPRAARGSSRRRPSQARPGAARGSPRRRSYRAQGSSPRPR